MSAAKRTNKEWAALISETDRSIVVQGQHVYPSPDIGSREFNKTIDHTLLKLDATEEQVEKICDEAKEYGFASVCVRENFVKQCMVSLSGTDVKVACVIGFHDPSAMTTEEKLAETKSAVSAGAQELDAVIKYNELKAGQYDAVYAELAAIRAQAPAPTVLKIILETSQLDRAQIVAGCTLAAAADFDFVKTSTGFNGSGATEQNVRLMTACCEKLATGERKMKVKASGGIRTLPDSIIMLGAGAQRLGVSAGVAIAKEGSEQAEGHVRPSSGGTTEKKVATDDY